ncbi:multiple epidermal growth factor-like domains protein 10 [Magallana gigas]|uniref:multiple epidermal growth factor-like domains protein 10 n=1 Tax=Magallana gigas TaxID=29159 RepID=UPI0033407A19
MTGPMDITVNNCSGHCLNNSPCNKHTGHCDKGCNQGYTGNNCSNECSPEYFGMHCKERCSGHCINNKPCHHVSGECSNGCKDGFIGSHCTAACEEGYFGTNCSRMCSPNCKPDTCRRTDGSCSSCTAGWTGYNCTTECMLTYGENCQHPCNGFCINQTCDRKNGTCLYGCKYGKKCDEVSADVEKYSKTASSSNNFTVIVGGTLGACVIVVIGIVLVLFVTRLKSKSTTMAERQSFILEPKTHRTNELQTEKSKLPIDCRSQHVRANDVAEATYALPEKTKRGPPTNKNISVRNMKAQIANMSINENAGFKSEYHDIPRGELHPCTEGKKPENKVKNRYTTIFPYDHSRIFLKTTAKDGEGYINANYIEASILSL